ncbi:MAG: Nif3-like dinuclear metal center hexameric protein [Alphaproteobacteria bacterium]|nr:Nif3-like dinuclear metal center hexameric protein [Alphaproteobacteria bacterium]MCB9695250.1 Nif3-like dinuclear metal center hexameric protein [Alphaproteobacteria bacterium]
MASWQDVVGAVEALAPPSLAGGWDNVGLLLEGTREVRRALICVDLTAPVVDEALSRDVDLVIAYHPPIFAGLKRLTSATPQGRSLLALIRAGVTVHSPHTALDAAAEGMNDWLLEPFGTLLDVAPLEPDRLDPSVGAGRRAALLSPRPLVELLPAIKAHLGLAAVRVATPSEDHVVETVAVCPGAGGSLFEKAPGHGLYLTGELRHHDVLALVATGSAVVLTDHTNTERGYLPRLASRLAERVPDVRFELSAIDADPLRIR